MVNLFGSPLYFITLFWMAATRGQSMFPPGASRSSFVLLPFSLHTSKKKSHGHGCVELRHVFAESRGFRVKPSQGGVKH